MTHLFLLTLFYNVLFSQQIHAFEYSDIFKDSDIKIFFVAYYMDIHFIYQVHVATPMTQLCENKIKLQMFYDYAIGRILI